MIIIQLTRNYKYKYSLITQKVYNELSNKFLDIVHSGEFFCPDCGNDHFVVQSYYYRYCDYRCKGRENCVRLKILRVKCTKCNKTHAVLIEGMVPFSSVPYDLYVSVAQNEDEKVNNDLELPFLSFIKNRISSWVSPFDYLSLCKIFSRNIQFHFITST